MPKKSFNFSEAAQEAKALIWAHRSRLALGIVLMFVSRLSGMVLPATSKYVIDDVIVKHRGELLLPLALGGAIATIIQAGTSFALSQILGVAAQRAITEMRRKLQNHIMRLPIRYFDSTQTGVLISRIMNDAEGIRNLVGSGLVELVGGLMTATFALFVLFYLNWQLTIITILVLAAFGLMMYLAFTKLRPLFRARGEITAQVTGRLTEALAGVRVVKAYTTEKREQLIFTKGVNRLFRNIAQSMTGVSGVFSASTLIIGTVGVTMILIGGRAIIAGTMTLGDLFAYIFFTGLVAAPLIQIAGIGTQLTEALAGLDRINEVLKMETEDAQDLALLPLKKVMGNIAFEDVCFEYNPGVPVLKNISFQAPAGSTTALVGSSGSGKSTLISLIMAFNRPLSGKILLDGQDLATIKLRDYRAHLGIVLQDNFLFDGTVADNIGYSNPQATLEEIRNVSQIAHCDEFITGFEKQYQTVVGERGIKLSGGQRQRIAIARAILAEPDILILDEATSSLDSESEALIQDGLQSLRKGRTTFIIAHRLSTIQSADQILVLEAGTIVERGTHAELLAIEGRYKQLYDKQYKFERNKFINPGEDFTTKPTTKTISPPPRARGLGN